jgi:PAS domain S-box-containing protein
VSVAVKFRKSTCPGSERLNERQSLSTVLAVFFLGLVFGLGVCSWQPREIVAAALILVVTTIAIVHLRRLTAQSGEELLAGDFSYREFFETAVEGVFRTTPGGHYLAVNPALARIYGYDSPEALKNGLTDISSQLYVDPHRRDEFKALMMEHDEVTDFVSEIHRRDGKRIWIKENARAVRDWSGQLVCYQGTVEDVTAKFEAERAIKKGLKRAEEANRTKNAFLAMMSHELKTPLNAIIGFSEIMAGEMLGGLGNAAYRGYSHDIHASGRKLLSIINDVLDVARLEGDAITLNCAESYPRELAQIAVQRARAVTGDDREIAFDLADALPRLMVDPNRLGQALANLLCNALKFTPPGGEVKLAAAQGADGTVLFTVSDKGIGMSEETIVMVLQPFQQADASLGPPL